MTTQVLEHARSDLRSWVIAIRPKTLTAAVAPVLIGSACAYRLQGRLECWVSIVALLASIFIQIGTNLFNDVLDFRKGADTSARIGPLRATQSGLLSETQVMAGALLSFFVALLLGIPLVLHAGSPIVAIGLSALLMGYLYTGGPYPLAYRGLGEIFVVLFFGVIAVAGTTYLHLMHIAPESILAGIQIGLLATVLIAINNLRDYLQDAGADKRTLAVRFGPRFAQFEIAICLLTPFIIGIAWLLLGYSAAALLPLLTLPLAFYIFPAFFKQPTASDYNTLLARAAALHILFGVLLAVAIGWK